MEIEVEFIEADTGQTLAVTRLLRDRIPASFDTPTTLEMGGEQWSVVEAREIPGHLSLTLRRIQMVDPSTIRYSLPTIASDLAGLDDRPATPEALVLQEDDWRQVEFISEANLPQVQGHLQAIQAICQEHQGPGFATIHVRDFASPLTGLSRAALEFPDPLPGVTFDGAPNLVAGSFAYQLAAGWVLYGRTQDDHVVELGTTPGHGPPPRELADLARSHYLILVDWCASEILLSGEPET